MMLAHGSNPAPDTDPLIECRICGASYQWLDYWKPRILSADDPRSAPYWCNDCAPKIESLRARLSNNRKLTEFNNAK